MNPILFLIGTVACFIVVGAGLLGIGATMISSRISREEEAAQK